MSTTEHRHASTQGFYSGSVKSNWDAVFNNAYGAVRKAIFDQLIKEPDAEDVHVQEHHEQLPPKEHGKKYWYNNKHTETIVGEHEHTDRKWDGSFKNWQGRRTYEFDFEIVITPRD